MLILHGADDPFAPAKDVQAIENEMRNAGVDYQVVLYVGAAYHAAAELKSLNKT